MPLVGLTKTISVATNQWAPYINAENSPLGTAADLLKQVLEQENQKVEWRYKNYDLGFELVVKGTQQSAFPYFKTTEREKRVLYSEAIFNVTSHLYYNRQYENQLNMSQLSQHKFGKVAGYSYGKIIDKYLNTAVTYANEKDALEGLLKNEIDFLPMTESVMNTMLNKTYRDQALLIREVDKIAGHDSLHLIAPKTDEGLALITKVNLLISQVEGIQSLQPKPVERFKPQDIARLIAAEGYPAIVGQTSLNKQTEYYTLPRGTRVLILKWSDKIISPSNTDRIYKSMIDLSHVVVLNGPHVGKELYVKNMHLEVQ
jgi:polar amino acid transport system substrate-binding protein